MNAHQNKNIFPVARHNYCQRQKPKVYVHVYTSISVLQNNRVQHTFIYRNKNSSAFLQKIPGHHHHFP